MMVERNYTMSIKEQLNFNGNRAEEKYLNLVTSQPSLIQRVPFLFIYNGGKCRLRPVDCCFEKQKN
jgi:hypothetical protein